MKENGEKKEKKLFLQFQEKTITTVLIYYKKLLRLIQIIRCVSLKNFSHLEHLRQYLTTAKSIFTI